MWYDATVGGGPDRDRLPERLCRTRATRTLLRARPTGAARCPVRLALHLVAEHPERDVPNAGRPRSSTSSGRPAKQYIAYSGPKIGWANIDPGTRYSTYALPQYKKAAGAFAGITLASINAANPNHPTDANVKVPYIGVQFVDEPWFINLGTEVSNQISAAIAGTESVSQALHDEPAGRQRPSCQASGAPEVGRSVIGAWRRDVLRS